VQQSLRSSVSGGAASVQRSRCRNRKGDLLLALAQWWQTNGQAVKACAQVGAKAALGSLPWRQWLICEATSTRTSDGHGS